MDSELGRQHRARLQREYEKEYREWFATLSPADKERLTKEGFGEPDGDIQQINGKRKSVEDLDMAAEGIAATSAEKEANRNILTRVLLELLGCPNILLKLDVMLSALGCYDFAGETCESLAEKHGVSKQHFDKLRNLFVDAYDLPPPSNGRDMKTRRLESLKRCQKPSSPSISQMRSASYTKRHSKLYSMRSQSRSKSGKS